MTPKISVIVPCYNQAQYLDECLQSVLDQTYQNWECIIVNDGSPDHTVEIATLWVAKDKRFKYIYKQNGGLSSARNAGIEVAVGEYILPLDADDKIGVDYIKIALIEFESDPELKVVYCEAEKFGLESGKWILKPFTLKDLSLSNMIFCSAIYRKQDWIRVGGYDVKMIYGLEDWEFWISILKSGGQVHCLKYLGFNYRIKENSMILKLEQNRKVEIFDYLSIKHADFFVQQLGNSVQLYKQNLILKKFHLSVINSFYYKIYKFPFIIFKNHFK